MCIVLEEIKETRKLASVQRIIKKVKNTNSDTLSIYTVLGWETVDKNEAYDVGDLVVYFEIDSILPEREEFEFLRNKKFRIKTIKLRGALSQGLLQPLSILPENIRNTVQEGQDVTEILDIKKYEIPLSNSGKNMNPKGNFPSHLVSKTDEIRIQSVPDIIREFAGKTCYSTYKIDGTSATFIYYNGEFHVCSRNLSLKEDDNMYWRMFHKYYLDDKLPKLANHVAIQGEINGPGVHNSGKKKDPLEIKEENLMIFDIYNIDEKRYLSFYELKETCKQLNINMVPVEEVFDFNENINIEKLLEMAKGYYPNTKNRKEGIVIRPIESTYSEILRERLSIKVLNNEHLLKEEE